MKAAWICDLCQDVTCILAKLRIWQELLLLPRQHSACYHAHPHPHPHPDPHPHSHPHPLHLAFEGNLVAQWR